MQEQLAPLQLTKHKRLSWMKLMGLSVLLVLALLVTSWVLYLKLRPKFIDVQACLIWEGMQDGRCLKSSRFTIDRDDVWARNSYRDPKTGYIDVLDLNLITNDSSAMWRPNERQNVFVRIFRSIDHVYAVHTSTEGHFGPEKVQVAETNDLTLLFKSEMTKGASLSGSSTLVQSNGAKDVWMKCANGSVGEDSKGGCRVRYRLNDYVLIEYPMRRSHLYRWREVNALILKLLAEKVTMHPAQLLSAAVGSTPAAPPSSSSSTPR